MSIPEHADEGRAQTTVLIVDDDLEFGRLATGLLTDRGYEVVGHAITANEAVSQCNRLDPDAVLLDVRLPDGNGVALSTTLCDRRDRPRILLTSTDRKAVTTEQLEKSGARGFVPKTQLQRSDLDSFLKG